MPNIMPTPDVALIEFFKNNEVFAGLFNGYFFNNEPVIKASELEPGDTAYADTIKINDRKHKFKTEKIKKYRDNIRRTAIGYLVILGIEDQNTIHYSMPVRKILYDALGYSSELSALGNIRDKTEWTVDEYLSNVRKGTKITPIITVVFYTGEDPWDGPRSLHDMMDIDEKIKPFVPDYPLYIIDIGHDKDLLFSNKELNDLKETLSSIYANTFDKNESMVDSSIFALSGVLARNKELYFQAIESKGGEQPVCRVLDERDARIRSESASELKRLNEVIEQKEELLANKDKEIEELKRIIAATKQ